MQITDVKKNMKHLELNFFTLQGSGNNMSPHPNQGMLPQNNMLLQGRSPNNLQQMMGLQMPVAPNMQLFNAAGLQITLKGEGGLLCLCNIKKSCAVKCKIAWIIFTWTQFQKLIRYT